MPRGPRRKRPVPKPARTAVAEPSPIILPTATGYCRTCARLVYAGDDSHIGHAVVAAPTAAKETNGKRSIYLEDAAGKSFRRMVTRKDGFNRVMGGGIVVNSITLIGGPRGCGKSTLLIEVAGDLRAQGHRVLYISAEEVESQIGNRAKRLRLDHLKVRVLHTRSLGVVREELARLRGTEDDPDFIIMDSAQTIAETDGTVSGGAGSMTQVMHVGEYFTALAKDESRAVFLVCQENGDGDLAGPQMLAHLVDVELRFSRDGSDRRFLKDPKNRFGEADEIAVYDMTAHGLREIGDVTAEMLEDRMGEVGVIPFAAAHLARPIFLAVEASAHLIEEGEQMRPLETDGYESSRLRKVLDRLQSECGVVTMGRAIRVEVPRVLGDVVQDDELDMAVAAALLSALHNKPPPTRTLFFGRLALSGHFVSLARSESRLEAARSHKRLCMKEAVIPWRAIAPAGMKVKRIQHIRELDVAMWGAHIAMPRPTKPETVGQTMA